MAVFQHFDQPDALLKIKINIGWKKKPTKNILAAASSKERIPMNKKEMRKNLKALKFYINSSPMVLKLLGNTFREVTCLKTEREEVIL